MNIRIVLLGLLVVLVSDRNAYASYLDPGTGSYMLQILVATFAAGFYVIKMYWQRIKLYLSSKFGKNKTK